MGPGIGRFDPVASDGLVSGSKRLQLLLRYDILDPVKPAVATLFDDVEDLVWSGHAIAQHDLAALDPLAARHALQLEERRELPGLTHTFSHFQLAIEPWLIRVKSAPDAVAEADWLWYNLATPPRLGLAAPVKTLLKRAAAELNAGENP